MDLQSFWRTSYLAVAYSNANWNDSAYKADLTTAYLMECFNYAVFSPITQSHRVARYVDKGHLSHEFWLGHDRVWMDKCDLLVVLQDGYHKTSFGVAWEIGYFSARDKKIQYVTWDEVLDWYQEKTNGKA